MEINKNYTESQIIEVIRERLKEKTARDSRFKTGYLDKAEKKKIETKSTKDAKFVVYICNNEYNIGITIYQTLEEDFRAWKNKELEWEIWGKPYPIAMLTIEEIEEIMGFKNPE